MVQRWIDVDENIDLGSYFAQDRQELRQLALFDAIINNTDRKIGHLLPDQNGHLFACDHGVTFHADDKLRTVLWQWAGVTLTTEEIALLNKASASLKEELRSQLEALLTVEEVDALAGRVDRLLKQGCFPHPSADWPAVPWPAF